MNEYLIVYIEFDEIYDENGYVINKIPKISNEIVSANNKKEVYLEYHYNNKVLNIIDLESKGE